MCLQTSVAVINSRSPLFRQWPSSVKMTKKFSTQIESVLSLLPIRSLRKCLKTSTISKSIAIWTRLGSRPFRMCRVMSYLLKNQLKLYLKWHHQLKSQKLVIWQSMNKTIFSPRTVVVYLVKNKTISARKRQQKSKQLCFKATWRLNLHANTNLKAIMDTSISVLGRKSAKIKLQFRKYEKSF